MVRTEQTLERHQVAARIVDESGGELAGHLDDFAFEYRNYGPFSERLAGAMEIAAGLGFVREDERRADWGGWYSVYTKTDKTPAGLDPDRRRFITEAAKIGPIELELLATAAFLNRTEGLEPDEAWAETARRKPDKAAGGRLDAARRAYAGLLHLPQRTPLPAIA
jgi:hypothetical protein